MITLEIQNLKCHGCGNTIKKGLSAIEGVSDIEIDVEKSCVSFETIDTTLIDAVKKKLAKLGYPEVNAINNTFHKAKSFVSCAIGRLND